MCHDSVGGRLGRIDRTEDEVRGDGHHYVTVLRDDDEGFGPISAEHLEPACPDHPTRDDPCG
ncbi:MAG: hypothetical protein ACOCTI_04340 [Phycisphaeraceae bacterium]